MLRTLRLPTLINAHLEGLPWLAVALFRSALIGWTHLLHGGRDENVALLVEQILALIGLGPGESHDCPVLDLPVGEVEQGVHNKEKKSGIVRLEPLEVLVLCSQHSSFQLHQTRCW